jgi:hypothetical protein
MTSPEPIFEVGEIEHGWAEVTIRHGTKLFASEISYVNDGLGEFVTAVGLVATGALPGAECRWEHEPDVTSIFVRSCGAWPYVELRVGYDGILRGPDFVSDFTTQVRALVDIQDLARDTIAAFNRLLATYGPDGYEERWSYPFPYTWLNAMSERLQEEVIWFDQLAIGHAVLVQVLCHGTLNSIEIAEVLGESHDRVVGALRDLEGRGRFRLDERDGSVEVAPGTLAADLRMRIGSICRDVWPAP